MQIAMIQDKFVTYDKLATAHLDRGTFFGDGVYEVLRSYNGKIFALQEHLERFANSLKAIGIGGVCARLMDWGTRCSICGMGTI